MQNDKQLRDTAASALLGELTVVKILRSSESVDWSQNKDKIGPANSANSARLISETQNAGLRDWFRYPGVLWGSFVAYVVDSNHD